MKLLFDTHAFIWWTSDPARLGSVASRQCFDPANQLVLSVASIWEMQIKLMLGKLNLHQPLRQIIADQVQQNGLQILPIQLEHVLRLDALPALHKDPFDRLLVAQALAEGCGLISQDSAIAQYPAKVVW